MIFQEQFRLVHLVTALQPKLPSRQDALACNHTGAITIIGGPIQQDGQIQQKLVLTAIAEHPMEEYITRRIRCQSAMEQCIFICTGPQPVEIIMLRPSSLSPV